MLQFVALRTLTSAKHVTDNSPVFRPFCLPAVAAILLSSCASPKTDATQPPPKIRITTGLPGMTFKPLGEALEAAFGKLMPDLRFSVIETAGSVNNLQRLQAGDAELGLALADVTYTAYNGRGADFPQPARKLRGIAVLHPSAVHVMVADHSAVRSIADLRGQLGVGPVGSGTAVTSALLLEAFGVSPRAVTNRALPFMDAADALASGDLDGAFVVAADPVDAVRQAAHSGARLVPISGETVKRLRQAYPFLRPGVIPANTYPAEPRAVETMLVDVLLLTREDLDEELVHRLTTALFEVLPDLAVKNDFLKLTDPERAPATPIPLHAGAALYYRERELSR
jgi:TRAP transporter TAXI family solute receptor